MRLLYSIIIQIYGALICIASPFNSKAKKWIKGRRGILNIMKQQLHSPKEKVWFHVSSLGEFEQGRTVIEAYKKAFPQYQIVLTFFSPSGYEVRKNYDQADFIYYLPLDTPKNASEFIQIVNPIQAFFVKYDFWYNYLHELDEKNIPTYIFSSVFRPNQLFFKPYGKWFLRHLKIFSSIFVQNKESQNILKQFNAISVYTAGDTRFDRVAQIASSSQIKDFPILEKFKGNRPLILLGSSWWQEEEMMEKYLTQNRNRFCVVIAPHDISASHIKEIKKRFESAVLYSEAKSGSVENFEVLIIDSIGILSSLYRYAQLAFIGGGFGKGIHNILEALTFSVPVLFGPRYHKFQEAKDIISLGGGISVKNSKEFSDAINTLSEDPEKLKKTAEICRKYIEEKQGATTMIMNYLIQKEQTEC